jgi:hypothetical protein
MDFPTTRITIKICIVTYRGMAIANSSYSDNHWPLTSFRAANVRGRVFTAKLPKIYAFAFFRDRRIANLAVRGKTSSELPQWKENFIYSIYVVTVCCSYGLISVLWIWILISLDPDPYKSCGSSRWNFHPRNQIGSRVVAKSDGSKNLYTYSKGRSFKTSDF